MINFILNNKTISSDLSLGLTLLDFIRKEEHLTGTKEGCREGDCGACTVLIGNLIDDKIKYKCVNSCLMPLGDVDGKHVVTIEGINRDELTPVQEALVDEGGTQCGFCTPGFVVSLTGYFLTHEAINPIEAIDSMNGNICRCTGYAGIKRAAIKSTSLFIGLRRISTEDLINKKFLPDYFLEIPKRLIELQKLRDKSKSGNGLPDKRVLVSGGTDLYVQKWESLVDEDLFFTSDIKELKGISIEDNRIKIGGATTVSEIETSPILQQYFPNLKNDLRLFGSIPIRNRATIGGNIVNASPIGDLTNILLALNSVLHLTNDKSKREIFLKDFYKGYKTLDKLEDEIVAAVSFHIPRENSFFNFEKVSKRTYLDIASVNSSMYLELSDGIIVEVHISAGGVAPIPLYLARTREFLLNKNISDEVIFDAAEIATSEISPISDARGSAEYKTLLLRQLILAHFIKLFPELIDIGELV